MVAFQDAVSADWRRGDVGLRHRIIFDFLWTIFCENVFVSGYQLSCNELTGWCANESWIALIALYLGQFWMAFVTGVVTTVIQNIDRAGKEYRKKVERIEEYMKFQVFFNINNVI